MVAASQTKRGTSRLEDYLEAIYHLNREKGYITTVDISDKLGVKPPTVSSMVARLANKGYLVHEPYRGMRLTEAGSKVARSVIRRHKTIEELLVMLGVGTQVAYEDAEGIEHHVQPITIRKLERLVEFLKSNKEYADAIREGIDVEYDRR